jgi:putative ABC transport system permease protein
MLRVSLKGLWAHKRRLVGTCSAVVLGVAFLAGTLVLGETLRTGFDDLFTEANAGTDVVVRGEASVGSEQAAQRRMVDAALVAELAGVEGVRAVAPSIEGLGQLVGADGNPVGGNGPPTVAGNWIDDPSINPYQIAEGRAPATAGEVVIDRRAADEAELEVGSRTTVRTPAPVQVEVVGIATFGEAESLSGTTFTAFTYDEARARLAGGAAEVSGVLLQAAPGVTQDELAARIAPLLPDGVETITGEALSQEQLDQIGADFLDFVQVILLIFTGIALLVATFSIYNTFSVIVSQRTRESALLRALGASRGRVLRSIVVEAVVVGLLASVAGFGLGLLLAQGLVALVEGMGAGLPGSGLAIESSTLVTSVVVGLVVTLVASLAPAVKASKVAPLAALREVAVDRGGRTVVRGVLGGLVLAAGVALVFAGGTGDGDGALQEVGGGALLTLVGVIVLGPVAAKAATAVIGAPLVAARGVVGELAAKNARRNPKRTASTASALLVGVAVVSLFTVFASSVKASMSETLASSFRGDLVFATDDFSGSGFSPELTEELRELPELEAVTGMADGAAIVAGQEDEFTVAEPAALDELMDLQVAEGSVAELTAEQIAVPAEAAEENGWSLGSTVGFEFVDGARQDFTVGAIFEGVDLVDGLVLPFDAWAPHTRQPVDYVTMMGLADGVSMADGRAAVDAVGERFGAPAAQDDEEYLATVSSEVDQLLVMVYVMLALSILIALMGIANTLSLSMHERTRELGLLRAVGQTRRQLRAMVRWESVVIAVFGTIGGVGLGVFLGWGLMRAVAASEGMGVFALPTGQLVAVVAIGGVAGVLAGIRPARRAARLQVLDAIA